MCHPCKFSGRVVAVFFIVKPSLRKIVLPANADRNSCSACICVLLICVEYTQLTGRLQASGITRMDNILSECTTIPRGVLA